MPSKKMKFTLKVSDEYKPNMKTKSSNTKLRDHSEVLKSLKLFIKNPKYLRMGTSGRGYTVNGDLRYTKWSQVLTHETRSLAISYREA